jgi:DNA-binding transcriptional MocR family regulator
LLDSAAARGLPLVEDSAYEKLRYDGEAQRSLLALDIERSGGIEQARVIHTSTFSKLLAPSLRVGWVCGPAPVTHKLMLLKQAADLHTSTLNQMILLDIAENILEARIPVVRSLYGGRRDAVLKALETYMPSGITWTRPSGGMYLWLTLPSRIDGGEFALRAIKEEKVAVVAGKSFYPVSPRLNTIRLAFPQTPEDRAGDGIRRLAGLLRRMMGN